MIKIAPSILSADFSKLSEEIVAIDKAGADHIHFDVMDGHFVSSLTFGPLLIQSLRKHSDKVFDVHLMINNPEQQFDQFKKAGADILTIHYEATNHPCKLLEEIKALGMMPGIAINPHTSHDDIKYVLDFVKQVVVMTVNPGFGGQALLTNQIEKIAELKKVIGNRDIDIVVDGGVNAKNAKLLINKGANILVAGSYIFQSPSYTEAIRSLVQ